ncbi:hypothetical protein Syun_007594 [Stephania yunnanensis]|uniref:non-specific serine/threonine protein kinase n=1 Tax=Stephania yunnanensis TaxID=152371 RepID=A0AAP0L091_9MAGN
MKDERSVTRHSPVFSGVSTPDFMSELYVMEFCEKSLVNVLERRGAGYFEEKRVLAIFRDVCNAVFAMRCQSPPVAHR